MGNWGFCEKVVISFHLENAIMIVEIRPLCSQMHTSSLTGSLFKNFHPGFTGEHIGSDTKVKLLWRRIDRGPLKAALSVRFYDEGIYRRRGLFVRELEWLKEWMVLEAESFSFYLVSFGNLQTLESNLVKCQFFSKFLNSIPMNQRPRAQIVMEKRKRKKGKSLGMPFPIHLVGCFPKENRKLWPWLSLYSPKMWLKIPAYNLWHIFFLPNFTALVQL